MKIQRLNNEYTRVVRKGKELGMEMGEEPHWIASDIVPRQSLWAVLLTMSHQAGGAHGAPRHKYFVSVGCLFLI